MNYEEWSFRMRAARYAERQRFIEQRIGRWRSLYELTAVTVWVVIIALGMFVFGLLDEVGAHAWMFVDIVVMAGSLPLLERASRSATQRRVGMLSVMAKEAERERDAEALRQTMANSLEGVAGRAA
jgi:hypothetical protein